jgi:hypothetical protein
MVGMGQDESEKDSVQGSFIPTGIRVGWDALSTVRSFASENFMGWEVSGDVDFRNYFLALEAGHSERTNILENGAYTNNGNYWRVGIDINMMKKDPLKNMFFMGFRFGHSKYDEQLNYSDTTDFGIFNKTHVNQGMKSNWIELTTGLKIKVLKNFWMGYTARMKLFASYDKDQNLQSYDIPGYGLTYKTPWWGFNYYLMYRIPIRKAK